MDRWKEKKKVLPPREARTHLGFGARKVVQHDSRDKAFGGHLPLHPGRRVRGKAPLPFLIKLERQVGQLDLETRRDGSVPREEVFGPGRAVRKVVLEMRGLNFQHRQFVTAMSFSRR